MSPKIRYATVPESMDWSVGQQFEAAFRWQYDDGRENLLNLYRKGKRLQWDAAERIDWSQDLDPENPSGMPDEMISIFGSPAWNRMNSRERARLRHHHLQMRRARRRRERLREPLRRQRRRHQRRSEIGDIG